jgi:hypothetical protein
MDTIKNCIDLNPVTLGIGIALAGITFYIIYTYILEKEKDSTDSDKDRNNMIYSGIGGLITGLIGMVVYTKLCNTGDNNGSPVNVATMFGSSKSNDLLQEDFYN